MNFDYITPSHDEIVYEEGRIRQWEQFLRRTNAKLFPPAVQQYEPVNPLNAQLNPICHLLALLGAHHILHVSRIRVNCPTK
jgi:hypothetical protein